MPIQRFIATGAAIFAAVNLGGTAEHVGLYGYAGTRYLIDCLSTNEGQANFNWLISFQTICGDFSNSRNDPKNPDNNQPPCHAVCSNRPERKFMQTDDEPEI